MKSVIILGAGGHAKVIADSIVKSGDEVIGFMDDNTNQPDLILGFPYLGKIADLHRYQEECSFVIGIGSNQIRKKIADTYDVNWYTAIHPSAVIGLSVTIGEGTVIMADAVINADAHIGKHCIINTGVVVEHDNWIQDYVHLSPHAVLCGTVSVGELTHIGAGATVRNNISIGSNVIIGAGGVVVKDITDEGVYIGIPAARKMME